MSSHALHGWSKDDLRTFASIRLGNRQQLCFAVTNIVGKGALHGINDQSKLRSCPPPQNQTEPEVFANFVFMLAPFRWFDDVRIWNVRKLLNPAFHWRRSFKNGRIRASAIERAGFAITLPCHAGRFSQCASEGAANHGAGIFRRANRSRHLKVEIVTDGRHLDGGNAVRTIQRFFIRKDHASPRKARS